MILWLVFTYTKYVHQMLADIQHVGDMPTSDEHQWQLLGQTAASGCEGFPTFRVLTLSTYSAHPEDGDGIPETSENLHILTRLSAREIVIELCRRQILKIYIWWTYFVHGVLVIQINCNTDRIEITNKMRPCSRIYYSNVSELI